MHRGESDAQRTSVGAVHELKATVMTPSPTRDVVMANAGSGCCGGVVSWPKQPDVLESSDLARYE
jgi:hypothetical protein